MKKWFALMSLMVVATLSGCVERALVITSEPTGADITVNQQWKGKTPYVLPFKHYGVYDIWIDHPGFEENGKMVKFYPLHVGEPVKAPAYQYAGADFVTEVLLPTTLRDQRNLHYVLERVDRADDVTDVLSRAQQLREASRLRTEMRYEKDVQRGRVAPGGSSEAVDAVPAEDGQYYTTDTYSPGTYVTDSQDSYYVQDAGIDATPPTPSEMPIFLP